MFVEDLIGLLQKFDFKSKGDIDWSFSKKYLSSGGNVLEEVRREIG